MIIKIKKRENPFAQIDKGVLQNKNLSFKARGIAGYLLSHEAGWQIRLDDLVKNSTDGIKAIRSGMKELSKLGYARLVPAFDENKQLKGKSWEFSETPIFSSKNTDIPISATSPKSERRKMGTTNNNRDIPKGIYSRVVDFLNEKAGREFGATTKKTQSCIRARINEGFNEDDFKAVIESRCAAWNDTDMAQYLRPETLFGTKFEGYLQAAKHTNLPTGSNTDDALKDAQLPPDQLKTYNAYIGMVQDQFPQLWKSSCRILSQSEWQDIWNDISIPMAAYQVPTTTKKSILRKAHSALATNEWLRKKYNTVFALCKNEIRAHMGTSKTALYA